MKYLSWTLFWDAFIDSQVQKFKFISRKSIKTHQYFQSVQFVFQSSFLIPLPPFFLINTQNLIFVSCFQNNTFPKPPAMIFLIDVSYNNIKSGMVHLICSQMRSILLNLPKEPGQSKSSVRVGFITYNNTVHFYNIKVIFCQVQEEDPGS